MFNKVKYIYMATDNIILMGGFTFSVNSLLPEHNSYLMLLTTDVFDLVA